MCQAYGGSLIDQPHLLIATTGPPWSHLSPIHGLSRRKGINPQSHCCIYLHGQGLNPWNSRDPRTPDKEQRPLRVMSLFGMAPTWPGNHSNSNSPGHLASSGWCWGPCAVGVTLRIPRLGAMCHCCCRKNRGMDGRESEQPSLGCLDFYSACSFVCAGDPRSAFSTRDRV